jgi:hypothetical protein
MVTAATLPTAAQTDEPAPAHVTWRRTPRFVQVIPDALNTVARAAGLDLVERAALLELILYADWRTGTLITTGRDLGVLWGVSPNTAIKLRHRLEAAGLIACHFGRGRGEGLVEVVCYGHVVHGFVPPEPVDNAEPVPGAAGQFPAKNVPASPGPPRA